MTEIVKCEVCGEPMPQGETMFKFHGYSGPCPKPPLPRKPSELERAKSILRMIAETEIGVDQPARSQWDMFRLARDFLATDEFRDNPVHTVVFVGGFLARPGNDERRARLVNQD